MEQFSVEITRHAETGIFLAMSNELKGLYVHARTLDELMKRIPIAARDIVEADTGMKVEVRSDDHGDAMIVSGGFSPIRRKFIADKMAA